MSLLSILIIYNLLIVGGTQKLQYFLVQLHVYAESENIGPYGETHYFLFNMTRQKFGFNKRVGIIFKKSSFGCVFVCVFTRQLKFVEERQIGLVSNTTQR